MKKEETKHANVGHKIKEIRKSKKLTQEQLSAKMQVEGLDITRAALARIETNTRYVKASELECIATILGVPIKTFLDNSE